MGIAGPSTHYRKPSTVSEVATSETYIDETAIVDNVEGSRYLTIKFNSNEGTWIQTEIFTWLRVLFANTSYTDFEDFMQSIKGTHSGDSKAPLLSTSPSFGIQDSQLPNRLSPGTSDRMDAVLLALRREALARSEISTSIPPRLPDFPWRNEQTLTFEFIET